jgi:hypothetical protein
MDRVTGLSAWSAWTQQHRVTKSGYLTAEVWLTSEAGGLGGNPKAFRIEVRCQAFGDDWK